MGRYLDPKADVTFKKVFGEHKNLVISLLNAMLPLDKGKEIESIEYLPSELVPRTPTSKNSIVDVRCEETGGRKFIVEMQMEWTPDFKQRVLFNASKAYVRQLKKSRKFHLLQPVYSLNFVNHEFEPDTDDYYHYYHLVHDKDSNRVIEGLHLIFVELPKFKAKNLAEKKMQVLWLRFLTEIDEDTKKAPKPLLDNPSVKEALEIVEESAYNDAELAAYDGFWDWVRRQAARQYVMEKAFAAEAAAEAKLVAAEAKLDAEKTRADAAEAKADAEKTRADTEKNRADAEKNRADAAEAKLRGQLFETARNMKALGLTAAQIAKATGLAIEEVKSL